MGVGAWEPPASQAQQPSAQHWPREPTGRRDILRRWPESPAPSGKKQVREGAPTIILPTSPSPFLQICRCRVGAGPVASRHQHSADSGGGRRVGTGVGDGEEGAQKEKAPSRELPKTEGPRHVVFTPDREWYWRGYLVRQCGSLARNPSLFPGDAGRRGGASLPRPSGAVFVLERKLRYNCWVWERYPPPSPQEGGPRGGWWLFEVERHPPPWVLGSPHLLT